MKKIIISSVLASMLTVSTASAFDDQREGFLIGLGAGLNLTNTGFYNSSETSFGLSTAFKIGYGFNNQFLLYYTNDVSWYGLDRSDDWFVTGASGIGASYYIEENSPYYVMGSLGIGTFADFTSGESADDTGLAFTLGGGYEYSPHVLLETTWQNISTGDDTSNNVFKFTINYMWY